MTTPKKFREAVEYNQKRWGDREDLIEVFTELTFIYQEEMDLLVDGKFGPSSEGRMEALLAEYEETPPSSWDAFDGPLKTQPRNRREVYDIFGDPGTYALKKSWARENIVECHPRYGNRLPGVPSERYVKVHKMVEPYLREALRRAQVAAPDYPIERIGGFVWRPIRGKKGNPLSMHSWGIAVDINPHWNGVKVFKPRGSGPEAWSEEWNKIWPNGVPKGFVEAFQSCGFAWGSDWDEDGLVHDHTFYDPMHFEWVARDGQAHNV